jgi:hypothetical protein
MICLNIIILFKIISFNINMIYEILNLLEFYDLTYQTRVINHEIKNKSNTQIFVTNTNHCYN